MIHFRGGIAVKQGTKTALTVCAVTAMLGAACASRYQNTPQAQLLRYLKHAEYTVIHPVSVQCGFDKNGTAVTAAEIRFAFSINESEQTDALIHDVFRARAAAERYLAEHRAELPETPVSMVFQDAYDSSATVMWVANYSEKGWYFGESRASDMGQLSFGSFSAEYGSLDSFADAPQFEMLALDRFRSGELTALDGQTGILRLDLGHSQLDAESAAAEAFRAKHPDCALSVNGKTVQTATAKMGESP